MNRTEETESENEPLINRRWNIFRNKPPTVDPDSIAKSKHIDTAIKVLKVVTLTFTFIVVLGSAVISKGTLLFMTSQVKKNTTRSYCNKDIDENKQFMVTLPEQERVVWIWLIIFTYMVPELGTFLRSARIICFRKWNFPSFSEFLLLFITESLPPVGSALLVFIVLPELDVIKGAMLTNAACFIPGLVAFFSRNLHSVDSRLKMILDIVAIAAQTSAFVVWPIVEGHPTLYFIPVSLVLISFGWWQNFTSVKSSIPFIRKLAMEKQSFKNKTYFMYLILAPWKCLLFFITTFVIFIIRDENSEFLFTRFLDGFRTHNINITEIDPIVGGYAINLEDAAANGYGTIKETSFWTPLIVWIINISATYVCYIFGKFACKIRVQTISFAFPVNLCVPVLLTALIALCGKYNQDECAFKDVIPPYLFFSTPSLTYLNSFIAHQYSWIWLIWLLSQSWITIHIWTNNNEKSESSTEKLFFRPMYDAYLVDQSVALNRRRIEKRKRKRHVNDVTDLLDKEEDEVTHIYACGTMWHETKEEMIIFLKSILRMDEDQCAHKTVRDYLGYGLSNYYEFETHILFDDAFERDFSLKDEPRLNSFVLDLIDSVNLATLEVHGRNVKVKSPTVYMTPYGGRLEWTLPGKTNMIVHLKDKFKVRNKKRWSQVMYMYYLLGHRIVENDKLKTEAMLARSKNTFLLALDGDMNFQPQAVHLLVDLMKKDETLGAACGRIHPVGSGLMAWYQKFEYAVGHWLQKATEHVIGCVLCAPGCLSLYRAGALMDDNVMAKYTLDAVDPFQLIQYDHGEDRWLCTLLLQRGYRVQYSAASDAYTHCPEGLSEFYRQRRRWILSTAANILDLLVDYSHVVKVNSNISRLYVFYQFILMIGTALGPGVVFIMLIGALSSAFEIGELSSFFWNIIPLLLFVVVCATCKSNTQLFFASLITCFYVFIMTAVLIGVGMKIEEDGWLSPFSIFFIVLIVEFAIAALLHPQEFTCIAYVVIYYVLIPSIYMLLVIYSVFNINNVSWGTREKIFKPQVRNGVTIGKEKKGINYSFSMNRRDTAAPSKFCCSFMVEAMCCSNHINTQETEMLENVQRLSPQPQENLDYTEDDEITDDYFNIRSWFYCSDLKGSEINFLDGKEERFWHELIDMYLNPEFYSVDKRYYIIDELKNFRNKVVVGFFMINSLFVMVVLLLTLRTNALRVMWPINPKVNFTYHYGQNEIFVEKTYIKMEPIGFVIIVCFAALMVVQFLAMLYHRFTTYSTIMANTNIGLFETDEVEKLTEEQILQKDPVAIFKTLIKLRRNEDDDNETEISVTRRNTIRFIIDINSTEPVIRELDQDFSARMEEIINTSHDRTLPVPRSTLLAIKRRNESVQRRRSQMPQFDNISSHLDNNNDSGNRNTVTFDNPSYEEEVSS